MGNKESCGFLKWYFYHAPHWLLWRIVHRRELREIKLLERVGHHPHCACRIVWGDGECECKMIKNGYDPYYWVEKLFKEEKTARGKTEDAKK